MGNVGEEKLIGTGAKGEFGMFVSDDLENVLHELSQTHGSRIAIRNGAGSTPITFEQLALQISAAAVDLRSLGIPRNSVVAYVPDTEFSSALLFLALSSYTMVTPVPAHATGQEFSALMQALNPSAVVVTDSSSPLAATATSLGISVLTAGTNTGGQIRMTRHSALRLKPGGARHVEGKGVILTTSGTTGTPKLVALNSRRLIAGAMNVAATLNLTESDVSVEIMPLHHIHGLIAGLLAPLLSGAEIVIQPDRDPHSFLELVSAFEATWYTAVPTLHRAIMHAALDHPELVPTCRFRVIRSSSSAMPFEVRAGVQKLFGCPVAEAYGMTEATHQISSQSPAGPCGHGNVGHPKQGTLRIQDTAGNVLPAGQAGEIMIKSITVIDSYLDNAATNEASFVDGWMRTGDIGRLNEDGTLSLVGREKEMIKRGGAQVAPLEIEDALLAQPGVTDAIAFGVPHSSLGQDVAAAVVIETGSQCDPRQLRNALLDGLSAYKVPSKVLHIAEIPKGPTGKPRRLDMHRLLADELSGSFEPQQSPMEELLGALFEEFLRTEPVGRHDDFFLSGGDSLAGAGLIAQLNQFFDTAISPELLFRFPTPFELASYLETTDGGRIKQRVEALAVGTQTRPELME